MKQIQIPAKQYNVLRQAAGRNSVLPILEGINFRDGYATATDLETFAALFVGRVGKPFWVPLEPKNLKVKESYSVSFDGNTITANGLEMKPEMDPDDFPAIPSGDWLPVGVIASDEMDRLLRWSKPFASKDELRPAMTGIYFDTVNNAVVATDAHHLSYNDLGGEWTTEGLPFILPIGTVNTLIRIFALYKEPVLVEMEKVKVKKSWYIRFRINGDWIVYARLIDARYPDWKAVIPAENCGKWTFPAPILLPMLERLKKKADPETNALKLDFLSVRLITMRGKYCTEEIANMAMPGKLLAPEYPAIGVNVRFLESIVKVDPKAIWTATFSEGPKRAIRMESENGFRALLMPVKIVD